MSKALRTVAIVAGVVALAATGIGAAASTGLLTASTASGTAAAAAISATATSVATTASIVAATASLGAQLTAKKPGIQGNVNNITISANGPIPYSMGRCFVAGSQLYDVGYGGKVGKTQNPYRALVLIWSVTTAFMIEDFLVDWQSVNLSGNAATGYYNSWLYVDHQRGLRPEPAALSGPWGAIPDWGADHRLSGYAAGLVSLRFDRKGKVWANGIPAMGAVGKWAAVYDPRADDTYPGGAGDHRFDDEDSFEWDRNVALNAITYARGRYTRSTGIRVAGCGFPFDSFDWPAWVAFTNVCEANGWNCDGTVFEGPGISLWDNLKRICAAGGAVPIFSGGLLSVRFQSPKVALDTITREDLADGEIVAPGMRTYRERINTLVPLYRSEANKWEYVQSDAVKVESYIVIDGEPKEEEFKCELVTGKDQAAEIAAYELFNRREIGGITIPCKPRLWEYRLGEALYVDLPEEGIDHLCVIAAIAKDVASTSVTLTLETETTAKHALALAFTGTAPPPPTLLPHGTSDGVSWENADGSLTADDTTITADDTSTTADET